MNKIKSLAVALALVLGITSQVQAGASYSSVDVLNGTCSAPSFTFRNDTNTGFYLVSEGIIAICVNGAEVARVNSNGINSTVSGASVQFNQTDGTISANSASYAAADSKQAVAGDLNVAAGAGTSTALDSAYLAGVMGNVILDGNMTDTENIVAGVVGKYDITGTNASVYPKAGVVAEVGGSKQGQTASSADGAFVAVLGGDSGGVQARAAFTVANQNSAGTSYFHFGTDFQGAGTHSGYLSNYFKDGFLRLGGRYLNAGSQQTVADLCILGGTNAPTDGTSGTGAGFCAAGSAYFRQDGASSNVYINRGSTASPTWVAAI